MIYFDNAATTYPKPNSVSNAVSRCIRKYCANPGRSGHKLSIKTSEMVYETRKRIAEHIGAPSSESIVFTENATHAINIAVNGYITVGAHVLISDMEHNSVLRPVKALEKNRGVEYSVFKSVGDVEENISSLLRDNTSVLISTLASNVDGRSIDIKKLSEISRRHGIRLILDASQYIGHHRIDLSETPCDALCAPGHKALFGIQGAGFLYLKSGSEIPPLMLGGSGSESKSPNMPNLSPERFEAGTLPSPSVISMLYGIDYIEKVGMDLIAAQLEVLCNAALDRLCSIGDAVIYGAENGIVAFNIKGIPSYVISDELDRYGIAVRSGLHCAPLAHGSIGTPEHGCVRMSFSYFNRLGEIDRFYKVMKAIHKKYN